MDNDKDIEYLMMLVLSQQKESKKLSEAFNDWLTDNNCKPDKTFSDHIKLYLVVAAFDNYIREISDSYLFLPYERKTQQELTDFLSTRFTAAENSPFICNGKSFRHEERSAKGAYSLPSIRIRTCAYGPYALASAHGGGSARRT